MQELMQHPFTTAKLNISVKLGKRTTSLQYAVQINTDEITDVFKNQQAYLYQYGEDLGYQIMFEYDFEALNTVLQTIDMLTYDYVEQKLTGSILTYNGFSNLFITKTVKRFIQSDTSIQFSCNGLQGQQNTCFQMLQNDYTAAYEVPVYNLYLQFYRNEKLIYVLKAANCVSRYTCWKHGVAILRQSGLYLELTRNNVCDSYDQYDDYTNVSVQLKISFNNDIHSYPTHLQLNNSKNINQFNWSYQQLNLTLNSTFNFQFQFQTGSSFTNLLYLRFQTEEPHTTTFIQVLLQF
ncbi:Hypothetical_protein [Hexamita inflata]|uniref:Hypothetical_protein n=1 Tax=Hexamita inflata TaxID=28002 RepID=A0AA86PI86_9EUKA|nr:Hypothetical protein HINF_LOCUS25358 [Hexamita inflata]CAI9957843.1 Hypothetical protein HINF_LOCUS45488 [Hexamita inflata]